MHCAIVHSDALPLAIWYVIGEAYLVEIWNRGRFDWVMEICQGPRIIDLVLHCGEDGNCQTIECQVSSCFLS